MRPGTSRESHRRARLVGKRALRLEDHVLHALRRLHTGAASAATAEPPAAARTAERRRTSSASEQRPAHSFLELDIQLRGGLGDLTGDRLGALLRLRAERIGLLGTVLAARRLPSRRSAAKSRSSRRLSSVCSACCRSAFATSGRTLS